MEITFAIIGSAGRKDDGKKLSINHFKAAYIIAEELMIQFAANNYPITHVVSGAAAWFDHLAVKLFLDKKVPNLRLFLPCEFDCGSFKDNGIQDHFKNPGGTANYYHKKFQNATHINSLTQIQIAKSEGAELIPVAKGFFARNALVAKSDFLLACTFGNGNEVKDGGTADTVSKYLDRVRKEGIFNKSFHYDLNSGKVYEGCVVPKSNEITDPSKYIVKNKALQAFTKNKGIIYNFP